MRLTSVARCAKPPTLAVGPRGLDEVEVGERMRLGRRGRDAEALEQVFADEVRRLAGRLADAEVHARLAEMHRQQLRVAVGEVQQVHVAEARQVVHLADAGARPARRATRSAGRAAAATASTCRNSRRSIDISLSRSP